MFVLVDSCQGCFGSSVWILCQTSLLSAAVESCGGARHCPRGTIWVSRHETSPKLRWQIQAPYWDSAALPKTPRRLPRSTKITKDLFSSIIHMWCVLHPQGPLASDRHTGEQTLPWFPLLNWISYICYFSLWSHYVAAVSLAHVRGSHLLHSWVFFHLASWGQQCILHVALQYDSPLGNCLYKVTASSTHTAILNRKVQSSINCLFFWI